MRLPQLLQRSFQPRNCGNILAIQSFLDLDPQILDWVEIRGVSRPIPDEVDTVLVHPFGNGFSSMSGRTVAPPFHNTTPDTACTNTSQTTNFIRLMSCPFKGYDCPDDVLP